MRGRGLVVALLDLSDLSEPNVVDDDQFGPGPGLESARVGAVGEAGVQVDAAGVSDVHVALAGAPPRMGAWDDFVAQAIAGEPDDPFVQLLRSRLASDYHLVSIDLEGEPDAPRYRVVLERMRELSADSVPHSPSFTRWSLGAGARMATAEAEARRFALLIGDRMSAIAEEHGAAHANAILVERLLALGPSVASNALPRTAGSAPAPGPTHARVARACDDVLRGLAADLGRRLSYPPSEAAGILDRALALHVGRRLHLAPARES